MTREQRYTLLSESYASNIDHWLNLADEEDIRAGRTWYWQAQTLVAQIATDTGLGIGVVAAVVSALSPNVEWLQNLADARAFCEAYVRHGKNAQPSAQGYTANREQAWQILVHQSPCLLTGPKRLAFFANICGDLHERVTVDRWATRAATLYAKDRPSSRADYARIEDAYKQVAARVGLAPAVLQAIVWVCIKRHAAN